MHCFGCLPKKTSIITARRRRCIQRGSHRPRGPVIAHDHVRPQMHECADCGTLVVIV